MLGPEAWFARQRKRKEEEKKAREAAKQWMARSNFSGRSLEGKASKHKSKERRAAKEAEETMRKPVYKGGWERKSLYHPFIKNREKELKAKKDSESKLHKPAFTGTERKSFFRPGRRNAEKEKQAREAAQEALRRPKFSGGWERKSLFHPVTKHLARERKALEQAKKLHAKPLYTGLDRQTEISRQRSKEGRAILKRLSKRLSKQIFGPNMFFNAKDTTASKLESLPEQIDICIVGAGFGGAYAAYEITKCFPHLRIAVLEKEGNCGGRLLSSSNDSNPNNKDELGGMRIFTEHHHEVAVLVNELGCHLEPVRLNDSKNLFYADGKRFRKSEFHVDGRSPMQMIDDCIKAYREAMPKDAEQDPLESDELCSMNLTDFLLKYGASEEEVKAFFQYSGYDIFSDQEVQAALFVKEGELYGSRLDNDQRYVREGYQEVVMRMLTRSNAFVSYETTVTGIEDDGANLRKVTYVKDGETKTLLTSHVVCSLPHDAVLELLPQISCVQDYRKAMIEDCVKCVPLFKVFLEWDTKSGLQPWWQQKGFRYGKSTTDLQIRQLHYYDNEDLLVYCSGEYADHWNEQFEKDPEAAMLEVFEQIKELHDVQDIPEPVWKQTVFKYWANGSHKWKVDQNVSTLLPIVTDGSSDSSRVHFVGDAMSSHQGWTMGCIETVNIVLNKVKKDFQ